MLHVLPTVVWTRSIFSTEQVGMAKKFYQKKKGKIYTSKNEFQKKKIFFSSTSAPRLVSRRLSNLLRSRNALPRSHPSARGPAGYASSSAHRPSRTSNEDTIIGQIMHPGRQ